MNLKPILITKKNAFFVVFVTLLVLLLPLVAMQFTDDVNWQMKDFVLAGLILSFFGYVYKVLTKIIDSPAKKIVIGLLVFGLFMFVWVSLI